MTEPFDVFLSYARADDAGAESAAYDDPARSFMRRLYRALTDAGLKVWWDKVALPSRGETFTKEIEIAIRACARFVLVCGAGAAASDYVRAETAFALRQCKAITPLLRNGDYAVIPADVAIGQIHAIDCRPPRAEADSFAELIARLRQDAPFGDLVNVRPVPDDMIERPRAFADALAALRADAIRTGVQAGSDSGPQSAVALYGLGGMGKSTLAAALARDCTVRRYFRDGVLWLEVGQFPAVAGLQGVIGAHFGDDRAAYDEQGGTFRLSRLLADKQALIVLDDVWDHKVIERFPVHDTACRLLITTRSGTLAARVQGADIRLDSLTDEEGARLIAARTGGPTDDPDAQAITRLLGGHTLAVALAAGQIAEGYADSTADMRALLERQIASGGEPFRDLAVDEADKDLNVARSLELSYAAFREDDLRRRFRALGVLAVEGTFDRALLAGLWGDAHPDDARKPLKALADAGLIESAENGRYSLHRLLRAYARGLLMAAGELDAAFARYADWVIDASVQFALTPIERWGDLDPFIPHAVEVGDSLSDAFSQTMPERLSEFVWRAMAFVRYRPQVVETARGSELRGMRWLMAAAQAFHAVGDRYREAMLLNNLGLLWAGLGDRRKALTCYEAALVLFQAIGDTHNQAAALSNIGSALKVMGDPRRAIAVFEQAISLIREVGDRRAEVTLLNNIATALDSLGEQDEALAMYHRVLPIFRDLGDLIGEAAVLSNIGRVWNDRDQPREALPYLEAALALRQRAGDRAGEATVLGNIAFAWGRQGDLRRALEGYAAVLPLLQSVGDRAGEAVTRFSIGLIYRDAGQLDQAVTWLERSVALNRALGHPDADADQRTLDEVKRQRDGQATVATIPHDLMEWLARNTFHVCTSLPDKQAEWREELLRAYTQWTEGGAGFAREREYAAALLALVDGQPPVLPSHPIYANAVRQVMTAIADYTSHNS